MDFLLFVVLFLQDVPFLQSKERLKCIGSTKTSQRSVKCRRILDSARYNKSTCEFCSKAIFFIETTT